MASAMRLYFTFLTTSVVLFALAAWLTFSHASGLDWALTLARFLVLAGAIGAAIAAWGTAISIAYVHRVTWPFLTITAIVVMAGLTFAVACLRAA